MSTLNIIKAKHEYKKWRRKWAISSFMYLFHNILRSIVYYPAKFFFIPAPFLAAIILEGYVYDDPTIWDFKITRFFGLLHEKRNVLFYVLCILLLYAMALFVSWFFRYIVGILDRLIPSTAYSEEITLRREVEWAQREKKYGSREAYYKAMVEDYKKNPHYVSRDETW